MGQTLLSAGPSGPDGEQMSEVKKAYCRHTRTYTHLWFNVQYSYESHLVDLPDRLQPRPVHSVLVAAVLQVLVVADVLHHLVVGNKVVVLSVLLILLRRSGRVYERTGDAGKSIYIS